ncbi:MAG TPA: DinB family protein [Dehalococcoidia bacterium]|nr:DinB family protein [Dehalococcoidia bacterium]
MNAIELFRAQINASHDIVEGTVNDLTQEACDTPVEGTAHPIGATYAHILSSEDFIVNMLCRGQTPLMMGEWAAKTGMSAPPPAPGGDTYGWATTVKVDLPQAREYAKAVYKATNEYLDTLSESDLDREMEVPGFGKQPMAFFLGIGALIHPANHIGEISALKGIQGMRGYPF